MGLGSEMKNLSDELLASFKQRIQETEEISIKNKELVGEVQKTLDGFRKDHQEMASVLNANALDMRKNLAQSQKDLASSEKERLVVYKDLMVNIHGTISSIQTEVKTIQTTTLGLIKTFNSDRNKMADELNKFFEQGRSDRSEAEETRMKDFDDLMKNINEHIEGINQEVVEISKNTNDMLARFEKEHLDMSAEMKAELGKNLNERVEYTRTLLKGFTERLIEIGKENQQMAKAMRQDLANNAKKIAQGEEQRLSDYKPILKGIQETINGIRKEVNTLQKSTSTMLSDLTKDRGEGAAEWSKMQAAMDQIRKSGVMKTTEKKEKAPEKKKEVVPEKKAEKIIEKPVKAPEPQPVAKPVAKKVAKPAPELSLEDKVLALVNAKPNGIKVADMEAPIGETRMKIGYVAKKLLDDGKVLKVDNLYFPKP